MGRSIPVVLSNGRQWKSKIEAVSHFKEMLGRYSNGQQISPDDANDLAALLSRYDGCLSPGQPTKAGAGLQHFTRQLNVGEGWATPGFHVHRVDGTSIDFSYRDAILLDPGKVSPK